MHILIIQKRSYYIANFCIQKQESLKERIKIFILYTISIWICVEIFGVPAIQKSETYSGFQKDETVTGYDLYSVSVTSKLECVVRCLEDERCTAAVTSCGALDMLIVSSCILKSISSSILLNSATKSEYGKCYIPLYSLSNGHLESSSAAISTVGTTEAILNMEETSEQATTERITTTTNTSSSDSKTILGMIGNLKHMCSASSGNDIAILTNVGIYIYDSKDTLKTGPCLAGGQSFESVFPGYSGNRPSLIDIDCTVGYESNVEMYSKNQVWLWQARSQNTKAQLVQSPGYPASVQAKLGGTIFPSSPQWCTYRQRNGRDYYFYENSTFLLKSDRSPYEKIITQDEDFETGSNLHINSWKQLPADTVAVCSVDDHYTVYIVVTSDMKFYEYEIDYSTSKDNQTVSINLKGTIKF